MLHHHDVLTESEVFFAREGFWLSCSWGSEIILGCSTVDGVSPVSLPLLARVSGKGVKEESPEGILVLNVPHEQIPKYIKTIRATRNLLRGNLALWYEAFRS